MKLYELRKEVNQMSSTLEEYIVSSQTPPSKELESIRDKIRSMHEESQKVDAVSEYLMVDRHVLGMAFTRALLLIRILSPKTDIEMNLGCLQRNLKPSMLQMGGKEILLEAVYIYILDNQQSQEIIEVVRMLKNKLQIKKMITKKTTELEKMIQIRVSQIVETKVKEVLPITQCETPNSLIMALSTILEVDSIKYMEDILANNVHPPVDIRNILRQLILIESVEITNEYLEVYYLMLCMLSKYVSLRKKRDLVNSKDAIYEILDDDCVGIMVRILEKECVPSRIRVEIMNILVESDIQTINYMHVSVDSAKLISFIRYVVKNSDQVGLLMEILEALEIEITDDGNETEISNLIVIMDFLNIILRTYTSSAESASSECMPGYLDQSKRCLDPGSSAHALQMSSLSRLNAAVSNSISLERYIGTSIMEVYNSIIPNVSNPIIIYTYLKIFSKLLTAVDAADPSLHYYGSVSNRNSLLSHSINALGSVLRSLSMYVVQGDTLYAEVPAVKLYDLESPHSAICMEAAPNSKDIMLESVRMLFFIILQLPEPIKNTISTSYVLNIVFRAISLDSEPVPSDILAFVRGFFTAPILHKLANSLGGNLYAFISMLIAKGELETVYNLVQNSNKLYKGILCKDILTEEIFVEHKEENVLYSLLSTMIMQYYTENSTLNNSELNAKIVELYNSVCNHVKKSPQMPAFLRESREFGYFFKMLCVVGKELELDCSGMLRLLLAAAGAPNASVDECQGAVLYNSSSRNISELYYFYHFVCKGVRLDRKLTLDKTESGSGCGLLCMNEMQNSHGSNILKYLALVALDGEQVKEKSHIQMYKDLDLSAVSAGERALFTNQIYRSMFLTGRVQTGNYTGLSPSSSTCKTAGSEPAEGKPAKKESQKEDGAMLGGVCAKEYSYADMSIRSAIKATMDTGAPHILPHTILSVGEPGLVSALLYTLYSKSPNSAVVLSYIKKMRKYTKNDSTVYTRVLSSIIL
ncbi:uncharacterized protein NEMAJ01_1099 [Nematocida major]|uniref:uncharacterized protein n=1 Tax=Nematocida major TaxID=1912982 RepID=UPI002008D6CE|nr:uncharacterized protein NEMAJ01_1099 [Nematocida major]KAH9386203.1 hypothetical protein NEMAJ01_1099 [Nematocida major]